MKNPLQTIIGYSAMIAGCLCLVNAVVLYFEHSEICDLQEKIRKKADSDREIHGKDAKNAKKLAEASSNYKDHMETTYTILLPGCMSGFSLLGLGSFLTLRAKRDTSSNTYLG